MYIDDDDDDDEHFEIYTSSVSYENLEWFAGARCETLISSLRHPDSRYDAFLPLRFLPVSSNFSYSLVHGFIIKLLQTPS